MLSIGDSKGRSCFEHSCIEWLAFKQELDIELHFRVASSRLRVALESNVALEKNGP